MVVTGPGPGFISNTGKILNTRALGERDVWGQDGKRHRIIESTALGSLQNPFAAGISVRFRLFNLCDDRGTLVKLNSWSLYNVFLHLFGHCQAHKINTCPDRLKHR